jgi:hypothetical protein
VSGSDCTTAGMLMYDESMSEAQLCVSESYCLETMGKKRQGNKCQSRCDGGNGHTSGVCASCTGGTALKDLVADTCVASCTGGKFEY